MENLEMLTGTFPVAPDQLAHDLAVAKLIKSGAVPASASGYTYMVPILNIYGNLKRL